MKMTVLIVTFWILFILLCASVGTAATYQFKYKKEVMVKVTELDEDRAMRKAAMICYRTLSNNVYPGEEQGLEYIDICANGRLVNEK